MGRSICDVKKRGNVPCGKDAVVMVTYFTDGNGCVVSCGAHIAQAVEMVLTAPTADPYGTAKVHPIQTLKDRILAGRT